MRRAKLLWAALVAVVFGVASFRPFTESDVFWHLSLGRAVLESHARTVPEPYALVDTPRLCPAPEWLWEIATYGLYARWGWTGLTLAIVLLAVGSMAALAWLVARASRCSTGAFILVTGLLAPAVAARVRERPEALVMVILPLLVVLALSVRESRDDPLLSRKLWLVGGLCVVWAQVHPTVVLAPALLLVILLPRLRVLAEERRLWVAVAAVGGSMAIAMTGALGWDVWSYVWRHGTGDAARHITDISRPSLDATGYWQSVERVGGLVALGLGVLGVALRRQAAWGHWLLAALGTAIALTARRGSGMAAVLIAPAAASGISALASWVSWNLRRISGQRLRPLARAVPVLAAIGGGGAFVCWAYASIDRVAGPIGSHGVRDDNATWGAAAWMSSAPPGIRVLTSYAAGAPIGFLAGHRVRVFIDSRTPMFYSDLEFAVARDVLSHRDALAMAERRFAFQAAVVGREEAACELLRDSPGWQPVVIEAAFSTFVRRDAGLAPAGLHALAPCGADYITPDACRQPAMLDAEIAALERPDITAFTRYLRAEQLLRCGRAPSGEAVLALLPPLGQVHAYRRQYRGLVAAVYRDAGRVDQAVDTLAGDLGAGDMGAFGLLLPAAERIRDLARWKSALVAATTTLDDASPPSLRAELARVCAVLGDADCCHVQAVRAAAAGELRAQMGLCWSLAHPVNEARRVETTAWLEALRRASGQELACPLVTGQ